ncbi:MAG TPA: PAS domain S-box protein [Gemmatimonadales bacterium]|nr:PAS domain S-box protein [Gemmatimonadales bacterium]
MTEATFRVAQDSLHTLGELTPGLFWVTDPGGKILYANRVWEEYTGASVDQLNEGGWAQVHHPDEMAAIAENWARALEQEQVFEMEMRYRHHDGRYRWILARVSPRRDQEGKIHQWVGTAVDVDELKKTGIALRRQEQELSDFFESAALPLNWVGPDGTILRVNQAELDLLGYRREEYVGRSITDFHQDPAAGQELLKRLCASEVLHDHPARLVAKDGSVKLVLIDSSAYFQNGQFVHTRCFTRDVTTQRDAEEASARLAAIVTSSTDAIIGKTLEGVVTSWNPACERIFGYSAAEMIGQSIYRIIPPELHHTEQEVLERLGRGEVAEFSETERIRKDGQRLYVAVSVSPIRDTQGHVVGASSIKRDVTERRVAAEALARSQERLHLALKAARMGTWQWDIHANALSWDEGLHRLYGLEPGTVTRYEDFVARLHQDDEPFVKASIQQALEGSGSLDYEFRIVLPDGTVRWLADQGRLVHDAEGNLVHMAGVCVDITERRQMEERLRQSQRMDAVGQLAGGIAHEANNMMSVVLGCADYVLQRSDLPPSVREDVDQIWRAAKRTAGITQQLLAFSRRQVLQPQVLDLNATVRSLEPIVTRTLGETRGVRMHLSPTLGPVRADPGQLEQVLINLTLNARDAMPDGGRLTIETTTARLDRAYAVGKSVATLRPGEYAALIVTDTGHGIERSVLSQIFEPFFTTKPVGRGTGLGLSTVYGIVKQSGGFIWVYSEPGLGTTFKVYLPIVTSSAIPLASRESAPTAHADEVVLVAEDESMVRGIMARTLRDCGYVVLEAADGREALELVETNGGRVSLIVADVVMPGLGGREMAAHLVERWPEIPVLFTSGYTGMDVVSRGLLDEGREFLQKPLAPEALARKVREMVDARVTKL